MLLCIWFVYFAKCCYLVLLLPHFIDVILLQHFLPKQTISYSNGDNQVLLDGGKSEKLLVFQSLTFLGFLDFSQTITWLSSICYFSNPGEPVQLNYSNYITQQVTYKWFSSFLFYLRFLYLSILFLPAVFGIWWCVQSELHRRPRLLQKIRLLWTRR